ncbi:MAG: HYR domain-containing protein, partial [Flavobacteriales bacterium]|nr:HYR domain-containing protein [Flavobacteriales bacterium]
ITCPGDVTVNADDAACAATGVDLGSPITADNCTVASVTNDAPASFPVGSTNVVWTVVDINGNSATCTQVVTVLDNQLPTITCPGDVTVNADDAACAATGVDLGSPITADNCSVASVTNNAPASYPVGTTNVVWTVTDANGNVLHVLK